MLKKRILTAVIALPLALLCIIFLPPTLFTILAAVLILVGAWEWSSLASIHKKSHRIFYVIFVFAGLFLSIFFSTELFLWVTLLCWLWILMALICYEKNERTCGFEKPWVRKLTGFFILIATWESVVILKANPTFGAGWLIVMLLLVFAADTGGYFAGSFFGKNKMCQRVSPKKTWEGFFGGIIFAMLVAAISGGFLVTTLKQYSLFLLLSFVTALFSVVGDLGISLQKRIVDIKDTGSLFPGHGGLLDRLDSIACSSVVFLCGALMLGL